MTLSILIWLPVAISIVASQLPARLAGRVTAIGSLVTLGVAISFVARFKVGHVGLQFVTDTVWISALGIHYKLGLDGLNVVLVLLTCILFSVSLLWASSREWDRPRLFYLHFGLAQSAVLGAFCAQDLALFVAFFDLMLIPFYFLVGMWGTGERVRATTKLVVYTLVGSFFMLAGAIATGVLASNQNGTGLTFVLSSLQHLPLSHSSQEWIFLCFAIAFLVKMPLVAVPRLAGRRLQVDADSRRRGVLRDPVEGRRLWLSADRPAAVPLRNGALPDADAADRAGLDPVGHLAGVHHTATPGWWSPTRASRSSASSRSGSSRCGPRARRARCCRWSTTPW